MRTRLLSLAAAFGVAILVAAFASPFPAYAQQQSPTPVNPSASVQTEQQLLDELRRIQGQGSIPDVKSYVIEQPAGRTWQTFHQVYLRWVGALAIIGVFSLLLIFYFWRGTLRFGARAGRMILTIGTGPLRKRFSTVGVLSPPSRIDVSSDDPLFERFEQTWTFEPVPEGGTIVEYHVDFEFRSRPLQLLMGGMFADQIDRTAAAFRRRARQLLGPSINPA
jgi:Polyketide cyclase / dehydrase and lipid transport